MYNGIEITYSVPSDEEHIGDIHMKIGEQHLHAVRLSDGSYTTHFLPFKNYDSIQSLARDAVDKVPYFAKRS